MSKQSPRFCAALAALTLSLSIACAPPPRGAPIYADTAAGSASLSELAQRPADFTGRTITTRGWVANGGEVAEGIWLEIASSPGAAKPETPKPGAAPVTAAPGDRIVILLPAAGAPGLVNDLRGKELELMLRIDQEVTLSDQRRALRAFPLQIVTSTKPVTGEVDAPRDIEQEIRKVAEQAKKAQSRFFRDPIVGSSELVTPSLHHTFLDPNLRRPYYYIPGPTKVERSGTEEASRYRFSTTVKSEDGHSKESNCDFQVAGGNLRSAAYEEIHRDAAGTIAEREHLDFASGKVFDKLSSKHFPWPENIYAAPCIGFALMGYAPEETRSVNFFMWSEYDPLTPMYAILDGVEPVTVPAGTFDAYRVRMNVSTERMLRSLKLPMPAAYDMARAVMEKMRQPDTLMWYSLAWPHLFLRMEGSFGPPGTTRGIVETTRLDPIARAALAGSTR